MLEEALSIIELEEQRKSLKQLTKPSRKKFKIPKKILC